MLAFVSLNNQVITTLNIMGDFIFKTVILRNITLCENNYFPFSLKEL